MTIDKVLEAKILRFHHVEGWGVHTIAVQLGVHHFITKVFTLTTRSFHWLMSHLARASMR